MRIGMPLVRRHVPGFSRERRNNGLEAMIDLNKLTRGLTTGRSAITRHIALAGTAMLLAWHPAVSAAQAAATFPKNMDIIVGMPPGGGVDAYARIVQRNLPSHLAGAPIMVVQNMPGAGSLRSVMAVSHAAEDGSVIGTFSSSLLLEAIATPGRVQGIDFRNFTFLGNIAEDIRVCYVRKAIGLQGIADVNKSDKIVTFAATARGTSGNIDAAILRNLFGMKIKQVDGYEGSAAKRLAIENGEVDGDCAGFTELPKNWLTDGKIQILIRMSPTLIDGLDGQVPFGGDALTDKGPRQIYDFLTAPERLGRIFMVSSKVPAEKRAALRVGFDAMIKDPTFTAEAEKAHLIVLPMNGEEVDRRIAELYKTPADLLAQARTITGE
jgi:tripartite-type tricarboxylate transporter receptor subunit TctC